MPGHLLHITNPRVTSRQPLSISRWSSTTCTDSSETAKCASSAAHISARSITLAPTSKRTGARKRKRGNIVQQLSDVVCGSEPTEWRIHQPDKWLSDTPGMGVMGMKYFPAWVAG